jgi:hypothetical protein
MCPDFFLKLREPQLGKNSNAFLDAQNGIQVPDKIREVAPHSGARQVITKEGLVLEPPANWSLLPPGDAALSRRVKKEGTYWVVQEKRGRKVFSRGIWAPDERIKRLKAELGGEREDPKYAKKLEAGRQRRAEQQVSYAGEFEGAVLQFLRFSERHSTLARTLAKAISDHAVPVGSGTVARTSRIPVERRAEAATIAWLRHQTTGYDDMAIPRVKGMRREVRRMLADRSRKLLQKYRDEYGAIDATCPLQVALKAKGGALVSGR